MRYVIRQIHPPGKTALATDATAVALTVAAVAGEVVHGDYLAWSNPNARHGRGDERWTPDLRQAKKFKSFEEAMACWKAQSTLVPFRPDGKPNRPMTAYSITVEKIEP